MVSLGDPVGVGGRRSDGVKPQTRTVKEFGPRRHPVENRVKTRLTPSAVVPRKGTTGSADGVSAGAREGELTLDDLVVACAALSHADTLRVLLDYRDGESVAETLARHVPAEQLSLEEPDA